MVTVPTSLLPFAGSNCCTFTSIEGPAGFAIWSCAFATPAAQIPLIANAKRVFIFIISSFTLERLELILPKYQ